jgi:hypothetical protein
MGRNLGQALKERALLYEELYLKLCTVDSINETERTIECTPVDDSAKLISVDLQAQQENTAGLLIVPKLGSKVLVGYLDKNNAAVLLYTDIDKIILDVENTIVINGGENYGLVKVEKVTEKLNAIEQDINTLKTLISGWTPVAQDGGAALKTVLSSWSAQQLQQTGKEELENNKIKH